MDSAAKLRHFLIKRLSAQGYAVPSDLDEVIRVIRQKYPTADLSTIEHIWSTQHAHMLVFIPASNGSAAEIGYFSAIDDEIGTKSIILLDRTFRRRPGYVALGPAQILLTKGAQVHYVDYGNPSEVWNLVEQKANEIRLALAKRTKAARLN